MINSISSMNSASFMMRNNNVNRQPPPPPQGKDVFQVSDTDSDGVVSGSELENLVNGIEEVTGKTIDQDTINSFDSDGDGGLNGEELLGLMQNSGFSLPPMMNSGGEESGMQPPPPPPPSSELALSAYEQNSGDDMISQLLSILDKSSNDSADTTSIDLTS